MGQNSEMSENACRLCEESSPTMHSVFERVPEGQQILQLIKEFLRILIYRTDPLSKQICEDCYANLANFSSLKRISCETLERQKERLRECSSENNISVRLYFNALEQENCHLNDRYNTRNSQQYTNDWSPVELKSEHNESELCAQLQQAIQDSLRKSKIQENHLLEQSKLTNGHPESQDDDSQTSSQKELRAIDSPFSLSQNAESQSDMELCDSDPEHVPKIITATIVGKRLNGDVPGPAVKRRRFVGPKSRVKQRREHYLRLYQEQESKKKAVVQYSPLSLMRCVLNFINKQNVPEYECESYTKVTTAMDVSMLSDADASELEEENICNYCEQLFMNVNSLAVHECRHMYVVLGQKVDAPRLWASDEGDALERNKWFNSINGDDDESDAEDSKKNIVRIFDDSTGRVNVIDPEDVQFKDGEENSGNLQELVASRDDLFKGEVVLIDTKATVNGVPLAEINKDDRRTLYKSVTVNGVKRKFCPLCRYTFKDNWAIESHYFSTACHYTCRFCGVRFNKQRNEFDAHVKQHIIIGDRHTTKIFASRKFQSVPRVINENKMKARPPPTPRAPYRPQVRPVRMKHLLERKPSLLERKPPLLEIKKERPDSPLPGQEGIKTDTKPQNQAYFCRKCYQVFFKLDEFNVHVVSCKGTAFTNNSASYTPKQAMIERSSAHSEPEKFSPTGRPMRNCVREIATYADDVPEDIEIPQQIKKISITKSPRGYECGMCSSCFPTVHSRNSHMRIHKAAIQQLNALSRKSMSITRNRSDNVAKRVVGMVERQNIPTFAKYVNNVQIKQEPMEPIVEIHEQGSNYPSSIGSVSITPIPNSSQKTTLDPNIMKLVQNNPNLTIKSMAERNMAERNLRMSEQAMSSGNQDGGDTKCYRCLSCSKPFANKSNLYFHKKNQCSGSKYPCPFCKKRFGTEAAYSSHIFYNHPE